MAKGPIYFRPDRFSVTGLLQLTQNGSTSWVSETTDLNPKPYTLHPTPAGCQRRPIATMPSRSHTSSAKQTPIHQRLLQQQLLQNSTDIITGRMIANKPVTKPCPPLSLPSPPAPTLSIPHPPARTPPHPRVPSSSRHLPAPPALPQELMIGASIPSSSGVASANELWTGAGVRVG